MGSGTLKCAVVFLYMSVLELMISIPHGCEKHGKGKIEEHD